MTPPRRPQPPLIDDGYLVEPEPVDDRIPRFDFDLVPDSKRRLSFRGCAWLVILVALALFWAAVLAVLVAVWR